MIPQKLSATLAVLVMGAAIPRPVVSQNRWEREVHGQLQRAVNAVRTKEGGSPLLTKTGNLNEGEAETFLVTLKRGVAYSILGVCDNDCSRLQLLLATQSNELAIDRNSESFPVLQFTPSATTVYRIRVVLEGCRRNPCWYAVAVVPLGKKPH
jgi:hypothetical protein